MDGSDPGGGSIGLGRLIQQYGDGLYPDLLYYYGVDLCDVVAGKGPSPTLVISLIQRLPEGSMTHALMAGGREHFGWTHERHLLASIFDALNFNTKATMAAGGAKKDKLPKFQAWPRPKAKNDSKSKRSVRDLYMKFNSRR